MHSIETATALNDLVADKFFHNLDIMGARLIVRAAAQRITEIVKTVNLCGNNIRGLYAHALDVLGHADYYLRGQYNHPYNDKRDWAVPDQQGPAL